MALVQRSLKRMLKAACAVAGMTLVVRVADIDGRDLQRRGWKCAVPWSSGVAVSACSMRDQAMRRVVGEMRIGGMALHAVTVSEPVHAAAPADLDHVAERLGAGRLADDAGIEPLAARRQPVEQLARAVDRDRLLVAGDEQADRAAEVRRRAREERARTAATKAAIAPFMSAAPRPIEHAVARSRRRTDRRDQAARVARRHDVGMAGEAEIAARPCPSRA